MQHHEVGDSQTLPWRPPRGTRVGTRHRDWSGGRSCLEPPCWNSRKKVGWIGAKTESLSTRFPTMCNLYHATSARRGQNMRDWMSTDPWGGLPCHCSTPWTRKRHILSIPQGCRQTPFERKLLFHGDIIWVSILSAIKYISTKTIWTARGFHLLYQPLSVRSLLGHQGTSHANTTRRQFPYTSLPTQVKPLFRGSVSNLVRDLTFNRHYSSRPTLVYILSSG